MILLKKFEGIWCTRRPRTTFLNFLYICLYESAGKITDKYMENLNQASGQIQAQARPQSFLGQSFAL